jgi:hypothetical protein
MSRPFASFEFLNRAWDVRFLETQSLRSAFVWLLLDVFMLGAVIFMLVYELFRQHRFDWTAAMLVIGFGLTTVRIAPLLYRRLSR